MLYSQTRPLCKSADCGCDLPERVKYSDLVQFDPAAMTWTELTGSIQGAPPAPRDSHGFAALDGKVYIFGGNASDSFYGTANQTGKGNKFAFL